MSFWEPVQCLQSNLNDTGVTQREDGDEPEEKEEKEEEEEEEEDVDGKGSGEGQQSALHLLPLTSTRRRSFVNLCRLHFTCFMFYVRFHPPFNPQPPTPNTKNPFPNGFRLGFEDAVIFLSLSPFICFCTFIFLCFFFFCFFLCSYFFVFLSDNSSPCLTRFRIC